MKRNQSKGFTLVEIMIVVAIIGLLATIAIPNFVQARTTAQQNACVNSLRLMSGAVDQWALEQNVSNGTTIVMADVTPYLKGSNAPICPTGGTYSFPGSVGSGFPVACSTAAHTTAWTNN